jgi:hypothetical protein
MTKNHVLFTEPTSRNLARRSGNELKALCMVLAIPYSGSKTLLRDRILDAWALRTTLRPFSDDPNQLVAAFKGKELRTFCKRARVYAGSNKYGMAASLLGWRNSCRKKGEQLIAEALKSNGTRRQRENGADCF